MAEVTARRPDSRAQSAKKKRLRIIEEHMLRVGAPVDVYATFGGIRYRDRTIEEITSDGRVKLEDLKKPFTPQLIFLTEDRGDILRRRNSLI